MNVISIVLILAIPWSPLDLARTSGTFEELMKKPDSFMAQEGTFTEGICVCTQVKDDKTFIVTTYPGAALAPAGQRQMMVVRALTDLVADAYIEPGSIFSAQGRVLGNLKQGKFWLSAGAFERTGTERKYVLANADCTKLLDELKGDEGKAWVSTGIKAALAGAGFVAGVLVGKELVSKEDSQPITP